MRRRAAARIAVGIFVILLCLAMGNASPAAPFIRGDADGSGSIQLTDPIVILGYLYLGAPADLACPAAADANGDDAVELTDAVFLLAYLYMGGSYPPAPFPACGPSPGGALDCPSYAGCDARQIETLRGTSERVTDPAVPPSDISEVVAGSTDFLLDLYRELRGSPDAAGKNLFFSPYSISQALSMTYAGAGGETERQMASVLGVPFDQGRFHAAMDALDLALASRGKDLDPAKGDRFQLHVSNSLWGQKGFGFGVPFLETLAAYYGAGMNAVDFVGSADASRLAINDWVSEQTEEKIKDLLPPGSIDETTRLVITNAIYFNASWFEPFDAGKTADAPFRLLDGGQRTVPLMDGLKTVAAWAEGPGYRAAEVPYLAAELSMVVILPDEGTFEAFEASLDAGRLSSIIGALREDQVALRMPRFKIDPAGSLSLKPPLISLGMTDAFDPFRADFLAMGCCPTLYVFDVLHKAFIAVDEAGTEAAAATAVIIGPTAVPPPPKEMTLDHPFIFMIRDRPTGAILFLGRLVDPGA